MSTSFFILRTESSNIAEGYVSSFSNLLRNPFTCGNLVNNGLIFLAFLYSMNYSASVSLVFTLGKLIEYHYFFNIYIEYINYFPTAMKLHF